MRINVKRIREEMARKQMSTNAVCAAAGMTIAGFYKVLRRGSCRPDTAGKIASALGIDPAEIIA